MSLLERKPHSRRKHTILRKYLSACKIFSDKYQNFAYIDTHGGTGEVIDLETGSTVDGSVLTAAKIHPSFPCYVVEIDPERFNVLQKSTSGLPNVTLFFGDCNEKIDDILKLIPRGEKFVFCFLDPDSLIYDEVEQLRWETVEKIAKFSRAEILVNLPVYTIMRCASVVRDYPEAPSSRKMENHITNFFGSEGWKDLEPGDYRSLSKLYISERLANNYRYKGAILIRSVITRGPLYYLVFGSNNETGGKIMRGIMKTEWVDILGYIPITRYQYKTEGEWLNAEYPRDLFIFED